MTKIRSLALSGIRGVRKNLKLDLDSKSCLLYGDNGTGKSTLSDAIEWYFYDKVGHLSSEEIGRKGIDALRNIHLAEDEEASVGLEFSEGLLNCTKSIEISNGRTATTYTNSTTEFAEYIVQSQDENLVLRYRDLVTFIISSKSDKLRELSEIIGFSLVTKTRDILQTAANSLARDITNKNFENQISHQQGLILEQFGENITSDEEFVEAVKGLTKDFELDGEIKELKDVNSVLKKIKKPDDTAETKQETYLTTLQGKLVDFPIQIQELERRYSDYREKFEGIIKDLNKLKKIALDRLLSTGHELLEKQGHDEDTCPLCLQDKNQKDLVSELKNRIDELEEVKAENRVLRAAKRDLNTQISLIETAINEIIQNPQSQEEKNEGRKKKFEVLAEKIGKYKDTCELEVLNGKSLPLSDDLKVNVSPLSVMEAGCKEELKELSQRRKKDPKWDAHSKITIAGHAYVQVRNLKVEQAAYEAQRDTMDEVFRRFVEAQKEALTSFLDAYSTKIDEIYQFLNPGERVENIEIVPLEKNGKLLGLTIEFDFLDEKSTSPPQKYLSESHLNCLGLAAFLASADAFNERNRFLVLDDVISSFDSEHRKRFADLIVEKYADYQIILLTHEISWFAIVSNLAKKKGWAIHTIKYNDVDGTHLAEPPKAIKEEIEEQIAAGGGPGLGNNARKFLEQRLKKIAQELEVKVAYRPNDVNEDRMSFELLTELKSKLKRAKCDELKSHVVIDRLLSSTNIANKDSHDYFATMKFGDLKAFWADVMDFDRLFHCDECSSFVSIRYLDTVNNKIRCRKGHLCYSWKK